MIKARVVLPLLLLAACGTPPVAARSGDITLVPTVEAPGCPESGIAVSALEAEAASGLRVLSLKAVNCGTEPRTLTGYPDLRLLDADGRPLDVRVLTGAASAEISSVEAFTAPPGDVVLQPGATATTAVLWRNTYDDVSQPPQVGVRIDIAPVEGAPRQTFTPRLPPNGEPSRVDSPAVTLDLGSTGRIGVAPWKAQ
ncbi:DUF4232 domain-containing protein [Saccharothrix variisporea]|uniref:DUF4232 domain-containing protein n=1 Tax=Saccharothrix variisporea TaxID=543527 RepID=UPI0014774B76|nr:DUF4232 domain-containing protein [Saccharothrix variisporea]